MYYQPRKMNIVYPQWVVLLAVPLADLAAKILSDLHPELHLYEWVACLGGAIGGQVVFRAATWTRMLGGIFVGYMAGLYGGPDVARFLGLEEANGGRALTAFLSDVLFRIIAFVIENPTQAAEFVVTYGSKFMLLFGDDLFGKAVEHLSRFASLFKKKG